MSSLTFTVRDRLWLAGKPRLPAHRDHFHNKTAGACATEETCSFSLAPPLGREAAHYTPHRPAITELRKAETAFTATNEVDTTWLVTCADFYQRFFICGESNNSSSSTSLMTSLDLMKKQCFASGTLSSASLKRRFIKKSRVAPGRQHDAGSECQLCRCSIFSHSGSNQTVRRILTACLLSFMALLGSVFIDINSNFDLLVGSRSISSGLSMRICLLAMACLIYPVVMFSFKQMTEWIQNYAHSLKEKTQDLKHQRQLAEDLLHQMLPKSVAKQLRQHKHVEAESYEKVTIFFSDIVGFTSISASCTPLQVVEMLNNLYMCFDTRIDSYDVYKVETIGDAYMVVSGLPERNGDRHVDEIAKMALDLVAAVRQVSIPHMPNERLQLRAGIHTGPCVAGIVGYKMPRYCLFGDTVNTASRMESTSLPQKIHISSETYLALIKDNAYELQLRGEIEIKGKGKMYTYWLIGHKNYSVQNDSLVCHWNPNMARKKKMLAGSQVSVSNVS
ncbi:guanylate cyclase soluble subunit beta-2 [Oreochromis aureus]|uniref:guanylate cyclase soluble subunit beta-2 n=1 Tax=Oreochromis aureus TaxID=47969 RepID=UPI00195446CD|nr:guanylate cyclase soluble subunit beta-2 [Oreochromis aureus]